MATSFFIDDSCQEQAVRDVQCRVAAGPLNTSGRRSRGNTTRLRRRSCRFRKPRMASYPMSPETSDTDVEHHLYTLNHIKPFD
jgi:hypothetical protein